MINDALIIGITGNIATGKSVVRRMLENSGCLGIDADVLAHRMIYPQGPAFQSVVNGFGGEILTENGEISRTKLGEIVFNDAGSLARLENLVHPHVTESIIRRVEQSKLRIVVIEAIKLLEAGLDLICDVIWISHASDDHQLNRLMQTRSMTEAEARLRIEAQPPQSEKLNRANVVITTEGHFSTTWQQVQEALNDTIQVVETAVPQNINNFTDWTIHSPRAFSSTELEGFWKNNSTESPLSLFEHLGSHLVLPLCQENRLTTMINWENWNFTGRFIDIVPASANGSTPMIPLKAFEMDARNRQCEVLLLTYDQAQVFESPPFLSGFLAQEPNHLDYPAWQQAAGSIQTDMGSKLWVKKLMDPLELKKFNPVKLNEEL